MARDLIDLMPSIDITVGLYTVAILAILCLISPRSFIKDRRYMELCPPIVDIPASKMYSKPQEAYETALRENGPIIGVWRKGRLEYIVNQAYTKYVFSDDRSLSFEQGVATILNLRFVMLCNGGKFFKDVDRMVVNGIIPRMDSITKKVFPIFLQHSKRLMAVTAPKEGSKGIDFFVHTHHAIAEAMLTLVLGETHVNPETLKITEDVADTIANLTGLYQNMSYFARTFPRLWIFLTWMRLIFGTVVYRYFFVLGPRMWRELRHTNFRRLEKVSEDGDEDESLVHYLGRTFANIDGQVSIADTLWISCLILSFIFASVHQTAVVAVWVMFELSARPSYMPAIREELSEILGHTSDGSMHLTYESLRNARHLDSFIREVLRLKGDTLSIARETVEDVAMGDYVIPKGHIVMPLATLSHRNTDIHGPNAGVFDGFRWVDPGLPATMLSQGYFPFGLGRWACPGRVLAVAEIKMIVLTLLSLSTPALAGGEYKVVDPLNITSAPPVGRLLLHTLNEPPPA